MIGVSNTSPIVNLAAIGQLGLLNLVFGSVTILSGVYHEIAVVGAGEPGSTELQSLPWIIARPVANRPLVDALCIELDRGEAEAIACAIEMQADLLLIDERRGRRVAERMGLKFVGTLGIKEDEGCIP